MDTFFQSGDILIPIREVRAVDITDLETRLQVTLHLGGGELVVPREIVLKGPDTIRFLMAYQPSALEGRRLRWVRRAWMLHNLIGHPLMQILSFMGRTKEGLWVHDRTIPRPRGLRRHS